MTFKTIILNRLRPQTDHHIRDSQNGFRTRRTTVSDILTPRGLLDGVNAKYLPVIMTFVDFLKGLDTVHCDKMIFLRHTMSPKSY